MQKKYLSTYNVTHVNGKEEVLNAASMLEALQNLDVPEEESAVTAAVRKGERTITLFPDEPTEVLLKVYTDPELGETECAATPASSTVHVGDVVTLEAFPARNYQFAGWKVGGKIISTEPKYAYTVDEPDLAGMLNILAEFSPADVTYTVKVEPPEASGAGCAAGPGATVKPNTEVQLYAVTGETYKFDGWTRGAEELGVLPVLVTNVAPLGKDEDEAVFTAKFSLKG